MYFKVGVSVGQGAYNFVVKTNQDQNAVKFVDILNDRESPEFARREGALKSLEKHLEYAEKSDVSYESVMSVVKRIYSNKKD